MLSASRQWRLYLRDSVNDSGRGSDCVGCISCIRGQIMAFSASQIKRRIFVVFIVAPRMLIVLNPLFVQLMHTNYYKIVKQLKSFKIIIVALTCFGLHKPSSGSSLPVLR